jgi:hypothetical protein
MEAEGLVAIKFKRDELVKLADRILRPVPSDVNFKDQPGCEKQPVTVEDSIKNDMIQLDEVEQLALAKTVACSFADLHDRPGRMEALGVIRGIVEWPEARQFFFYRLSLLTWQSRLANRAAHLTRISKGATEDLDYTYDCVVSELYSKWLPSLLQNNNSLSKIIFYNEDARNVHLLEQNYEQIDCLLRKWCTQRTIDRIGVLLASLSSEDRSRIPILQ